MHRSNSRFLRHALVLGALTAPAFARASSASAQSDDAPRDAPPSEVAPSEAAPPPPASIYPGAPQEPGAVGLSAPAPAGPVSARPQVSADAQQRAQRVAELRKKRNQVSLGVPIGLSAAGVGLLAAAASSGIQALIHSDGGNCDQHESSASCLDRGFVWGFAGASIGTGVLGAVLLGVGIPKLRRAMDERRAIRDEMRSVSTPSFALNVGKTSAGLVLRARF